MTSPETAVRDRSVVPDFTIKREPHRFTLDGEDFAAPAIISPITLRKLAAAHASLNEVDIAGGVANASLEQLDHALKGMANIFKILVPGQGGQRLADRLMSEEDPIDLQLQAMPIFYFLLERYFGRPIVPASPSSAGSTGSETGTQNDGTSSTGGVSETAEEITSDSIPPTGST